VAGALLVALSTIPFAAETPAPLGAEKQTSVTPGTDKQTPVTPGTDKQTPVTLSVEKQLTRAQALKAVDNVQLEARVAGIERLAEVGTMSDVDKVIARLRDENDNVRELAAAALWHIWSRSGDPDIDALYQQGIRQMQTANLDDALTTFPEIIRRKPQFAE